MAEEEKNEETENEQPEAENAAAEPPEPEPEVEEAPAEEASAPAPAPAAEAPADDEEPAPTHPKAIRKARRSQAPAEAKPERGSEQRATDREERRKAAAVSRRRYRQAQRGKRGESGTGTPPAERELAERKIRQGKVVSSKGNKSITVQVEQVGRHRRYEKVVRHSRTMHAHDEQNQASEGDVVRIVETRPLSRTKRWRLVEIVERAR